MNRQSRLVDLAIALASAINSSEISKPTPVAPVVFTIDSSSRPLLQQSCATALPDNDILLRRDDSVVSSAE
jgi:hypothetical protein